MNKPILMPIVKAPRASARRMALHFLERGRYSFNQAQASRGDEELLEAIKDARVCLENAELWLSKKEQV